MSSQVVMMRKTGKPNRNRWSKKGRASHKPIEEELQQPLETAAGASVTTDAAAEARANARYDAAAAVRSMNRSSPQRTPQPPPGYHPEAAVGASQELCLLTPIQKPSPKSGLN